MTHDLIRCHRCGLRIPEQYECEEAHDLFEILLECADDEPEEERTQTLRTLEVQKARHIATLCHCPDRPWSLFSSQPQPENLDWHDKHDR